MVLTLFVSDEPKTFLVQFLEELDAGRGGTFDLPALFDESNIESIFGMLDPTNTGFISLEQYKEGTHCAVSFANIIRLCIFSSKI